MHRSSRLQSTNWTSAPARIAASGVAMNVFDGHSTVSPWTPAKCSAASAPPAQLESATAGSSFHASQAASKRAFMSASDQRLESSTSSISSCRRARSRWSKPIAKRAKSGAVWSEAEAEAVVMLGSRTLTRERRAAPPADGVAPACRLPILPARVRAGKRVRQVGRYRVSAVCSSARISSSAAAVRRCEPRGAVEVGVVQQDHVSRRHSVQSPARRSAPAS